MSSEGAWNVQFSNNCKIIDDVNVIKYKNERRECHSGRSPGAIPPCAPPHYGGYIGETSIQKKKKKKIVHHFTHVAATITHVIAVYLR